MTTQSKAYMDVLLHCCEYPDECQTAPTEAAQLLYDHFWNHLPEYAQNLILNILIDQI